MKRFFILSRAPSQTQEVHMHPCVNLYLTISLLGQIKWFVFLANQICCILFAYESERRLRIRKFHVFLCSFPYSVQYGDSIKH